MSLSALCSITVNLVRPYVPNRRIDWSRADLTANAWSYTDPSVEAEFRRFLFRDTGCFSMALGIALGYVNFSFFLQNGIVAGFRIVFILSAVALFLLAFIDMFLIYVNRWTVRDAHLRMYVSAVAGLVMVVPMALCFSSSYASCERTPDYLVPKPIDPNHVLERVQRDCVDVINPLLSALIVGGLAAVNMHPLHAGIEAVMMLGCTYVGYIASTPNYLDRGETTVDLGLKLIIYLICFAAMISVNVLRMRYRRKQFKATVLALAQSIATKARTKEVDRVLLATMPIAALDKLVTKERVFHLVERASVMHSELSGFAAWRKNIRHQTRTVVAVLNAICIELDSLAVLLAVEKAKTLGDGYIAVCGLPDGAPDHADRLCGFAARLLRVVHRISRAASWFAPQPRAAVCSGPLGGAVFGSLRFSYDPFGPVQSQCWTLLSRAPPNSIVVSSGTASSLLSTDVQLVPLLDDALSSSSTESRRHVTTAFAQPVPASTNEAAAAVGDQALLITPAGLEALCARYDVDPARDERASLCSSFRSGRSRESRDTAKVAPPRPDLFASEVSIIRQRRHFAQQLAAREALVGFEADDTESLEARISQRKWRFLLQTFEDDALEAEFQQRTRRYQRSLDVVTRILFVVFIAGQWIVLLADPKTVTGVAGLTLLSAATVLSIGLAFFSRATVTSFELPWNLDILLVYVMCLLDVIGCGLMPYSIIGNEVTYAVLYLLSIVAATVPRANILVHQAFNGVMIGVSQIFVWSTISFATHFELQILFAILCGVWRLSDDIVRRRVFVDQKLQEHEVALESKRDEELSAVLSAVVPAHVSELLCAWVQTMDTTRSLVTDYSTVVVAVIQLLPGVGTIHQNRRQAPLLPGHVVASSSRSVIDEWDWLVNMHLAVDEEIIRRQPLIDKVKTIGDTVIAAGSFHSEHSVLDAANAMFDCVTQLDAIGRVAAGLHVGEVSGVVLGTARLGFDIVGEGLDGALAALRSIAHNEAAVVATEDYRGLWMDSATTSSTSTADSAWPRSPFDPQRLQDSPENTSSGTATYFTAFLASARPSISLSSTVGSSPLPTTRYWKRSSVVASAQPSPPSC